MIQTEQTFKIVTNSFEGPFDLLLFFIERDELDIYDIPISKITDDFLLYLEECKSLDLDVASEFILVAAKLMRIKAKMLLPRKEKNEAGEEIDPREELVSKLLEYKAFKDTLDDFMHQAEMRTQITERGNQKDDLKTIAQKALVDLELENLNLTTLFNTYKRVMLEMQRRESKIVHRVVRYPYTIKTQKAYLNKKLTNIKKATFEDIFAEITDRMEAIVTFLSMLELLNQSVIKLLPGKARNSFWLSKVSDFPIDEELV